MVQSISLVRSTLCILASLPIVLPSHVIHVSNPKMVIYSLNALLLKMLTGKLPAPDDQLTLLLTVHRDPLKDLIRRCLRERIENRPLLLVISSLNCNNTKIKQHILFEFIMQHKFVIFMHPMHFLTT